MTKAMTDSTKCVMVGSLKGGVGKTTVSTNLARSLGTPAVVDADIDSSNFASVMGLDEKGEVTTDHEFVPATADGIDIYSVETMFEDSTISMKEGAMADLAERLVHHALKDNPEYLLIDCPPGASSVFRQLISTLSERGIPRTLVAVNQPNAMNDLERQIDICNHVKLPIAGFVENMSGTTIDDDFAPFGKGNVANFVEEAGGNFFGRVPLATPEERDIVMTGLTDDIVDYIESVDVFMDADTHADPSLYDKLMQSLSIGSKVVSNEIPIDQLQREFGVQDANLTLEIDITDLDKTFHVGVREGAIRPIRDPSNVAGGVKLPLRELRDGLAFEREAIYAPTHETMTVDYSLTKSVKLGFAEIWQDLDNVDIAMQVNAWDMLVTLEYLIREKVGKERLKEIARETGAAETI